MGEGDLDSLILLLEIKVWVAAGGQMVLRARYDWSEMEGANNIIKKGW